MMRLQFFTSVVWFWESPNWFWYWRTKSKWAGETLHSIYYGHFHLFLVHFWPRSQFQVKYRAKTWKLKMSYFACFNINQVAPKGQFHEKLNWKFFFGLYWPKNPKNVAFLTILGHFMQIWQNLEKTRNELYSNFVFTFSCKNLKI